MRTFLIISSLTPKAKLTPLRKNLQRIWKTALLNQSYSGWKQLVFGEKESHIGNIKTVSLNQDQPKPAIRKDKAALFDREDVLEFIHSADYVLKLDDDDLISPNILEEASTLDFDIFHDRFHTFYSLSCGTSSQQARSWMPATCIHKLSHALSPVDPEGIHNIYLNSLFYSDHSKTWHTYYEGKKQVIANRETPLYLRVVSPTSKTAGGAGRTLQTPLDIHWPRYLRHLRGFGSWDRDFPEIFTAYQDALAQAWVNFSGQEPEPLSLPNGRNQRRPLRFLRSVLGRR